MAITKKPKYGLMFVLEERSQGSQNDVVPSCWDTSCYCRRPPKSMVLEQILDQSSRNLWIYPRQRQMKAIT